MKAIISIIIPVYNVEKYLAKCLYSCVNQTFKNIEIIVVNDCSPDNSDIIMNSYERKYPEIIKCIYLTENIKQGGARNRGLEIAQGDYVLFVDGDDYIAFDMCEKLYKSAISNNADIVICDMFRVVNEQLYYKSAFYNKVEPQNNIDKIEILQKYIVGVPCNKLIKKLFVVETLFPEKTFYEDFPVVLVWVLKAKTINYISQPLYYYVARESSTISKSDFFNEIQYSNALILLVYNLKKYDLFDKFYDEICEYVLRECVIFLTRYIMNLYKENSKEIEQLRLCLIENIPNWTMYLHDLKYFENNIIQKFLMEDNYIGNLIKNSKESLENLFNNVVGIWGTGIYGKFLLKYLRNFNINPNYFIDSNERLQGTYVQNILVKSFDEIKEECDLIIVAIKDYSVYKEIKEKVCKENSNIKLKYFAELF